MSYESVGLLLPCDGANGGTSFPDYSRHDSTVSVVGDAQTSTAQSQYYGSSLLLDGAGDYLDVGTVLEYGSGDFTVEFWLYLLSSPGQDDVIFDFRTAASSTPFNLSFELSGGPRFAAYWGDVNKPVWSVAAVSTWTHVALQRESGTLSCFVDGVAQSLNSGTATGRTDDLGTRPARIGSVVGTPGSYLHAHLADIRVTVGLARYTDPFTPPARLVAPVAGTITGDGGSPTDRRVWVIPRTWPTRVFSALSDPGDGTFSIDAPNVQCARVVLDDDAGTQYNDLIDRVDVAV